MIGYYLDLARRSFRRNKALTALMVIALAFGIGASMTTLTVLHVLSHDPIPGKSEQLHAVQIDPRPLKGYVPGHEPLNQLSRADAEALVRAGKAKRQALMTGGSAAIEPARPDVPPFFADSRWTSADFFPMFRVPFLAGAPWTAADDDAHARVVVIARPLADKLFGTVAVVGKSVRIEGNDFRIVGVIDDWRPAPKFFDLNNQYYGAGELAYVPWSTSRDLHLPRNGTMNCWDQSEGDETAVGVPCEWIQFWVELDSDQEVAAYHDFLVSYSVEQMRAGRFGRPPNVRLRNVMQWLDYNHVVPNDVRLQMWISVGFLLVCVINTIGLLLTKFMRRSAEIGVRRALGASKRSIFVQLLIEAGSIGLVGGIVGLGLAWLGLWAVRHQPTDYADLARLDMPMLAATFGLALATSVLAGLLPAWRGCHVTPAIQLKSH